MSSGSIAPRVVATAHPRTDLALRLSRYGSGEVSVCLGMWSETAEGVRAAVESCRLYFVLTLFDLEVEDLDSATQTLQRVGFTLYTEGDFQE